MKHLKSIPIILSLALVIFGCQDKAKEYYNNGYKNLISYNDFNTAIDNFTKVIDMNSENYKMIALYNRGICYYYLKKYQLALNDFNSIKGPLKNVDRINIDEWYFTIKAECYFELKKYPEALSEINKAIKCNSHYKMKWQWLLYRAKYKYATGDIIGAKADSSLANKIKPEMKNSFEDFRKSLKPVLNNY